MMNFIISFLVKFISSFITMSVIVFCWHKLLCRKINFKSPKMYIVLSLLSVISIVNYYLTNQYLKAFVITLFLIISFAILFKEKINKVIITPIFVQIISMVSEAIFVFILCIIFDMDNLEIINTQFGQFFSNAGISLITFIIGNISIVSKIYKFVTKITDKIKTNQLIVLAFIIILISNISGLFLYFEVEFRYLLIFNAVVTIFFASLTLYYLKAKNNYIKVYEKYNTTLNSLREYEDILDRYRISNHENKNQILTIRNMVPKTNKKLISYIDELIDNKLKDNDKVMSQVSKIPAGGLRGLFYSKILYMLELKINYSLEISKDIKTADFIQMDSNLMLDLCKVIGVFLDNAIEAVKTIKNKFIAIEMYTENDEIIICISNNYKGNIDLNKLENKGYSSKGNGHGYGLVLAKEIITNNSKLENQKKINKTVFTQILKIKM